MKSLNQERCSPILLSVTAHIFDQAKSNLLPQLERMSLVNSLYTHAADDSVMENLK